MRVLIALLPLAASLSACGSDHDNAKGTDITVDATGKDGEKVSIRADGETGKVGVNIPGFDANIKLPKVMLNNADFDIDGVKLYPGTSIKSVNVQADENKAVGKQGFVKMTFEAPADSAKVGKWYSEQFAKNGITLTGDAKLLSGKTKDGDPFSIQLGDIAGGKTSGTISISG